MTARYDLLLNAIQTTNATVANFFLFALGIIAGYYALAWVPAWMQRPARWLYVAALLVMFVLATVFSAGA